MKKTNLADGRKGQKGRVSQYDLSFRRYIARKYRDGNKSLAQIAREYGLSRYQVSEWYYRFCSELSEDVIVPLMTEQEQKEVEMLQKQIEALKKKLEYEQMRNFAWETMADLAKTELGIDIRKNFGAKQPKQ